MVGASPATRLMAAVRSCTDFYGQIRTVLAAMLLLAGFTLGFAYMGWSSYRLIVPCTHGRVRSGLYLSVIVSFILRGKQVCALQLHVIRRRQAGHASPVLYRLLLFYSVFHATKKAAQKLAPLISSQQLTFRRYRWRWVRSFCQTHGF